MQIAAGRKAALTAIVLVIVASFRGVGFLFSASPARHTADRRGPHTDATAKVAHVTN